MSRLGKKPLNIPEKVKVAFTDQVLSVAGPQGSMKQPVHAGMDVKIDATSVLVVPRGQSRELNAIHGLTRGLVKNALTGASVGFTRNLEIQGLGFKSSVEGSTLHLTLGFSHPVTFPIPAGIKITVEKNTLITVAGVDKSLVGLVASSIRAIKPPEPYKGTGVRYVGEHIIRKAGKAAAGSAGAGAGGGGGGGKK